MSASATDTSIRGIRSTFFHRPNFQQRQYGGTSAAAEQEEALSFSMSAPRIDDNSITTDDPRYN